MSIFGIALSIVGVVKSSRRKASTVEELVALASLRYKGIITEEEYQEKSTEY